MYTYYYVYNYLSTHFDLFLISLTLQGSLEALGYRRGRECMVVGFTTT